MLRRFGFAYSQEESTARWFCPKDGAFLEYHGSGTHGNQATWFCNTCFKKLFSGNRSDFVRRFLPWKHPEIDNI